MDLDNLIQAIQFSKPYQNISKWASLFGINLPQPKFIFPLPEKDRLEDPRKLYTKNSPQASEVQGTQTTDLNNLDGLISAIQAGFNRYGNPPMATMAAQLATLGNELNQRNKNISPYFPAALSIKETSGLSGENNEINRRLNNPFGIGPRVQYPDLETAILGGGPNNQRGLRGVLTGGLYDDFLKSGDLLDFFRKYTPEDAVGHNNPSYTKQIQDMNSYLQYFQ